MPTTQGAAPKHEWLPAQRTVPNAHSPFAAELYNQINQARTNPIQYATEMEKDDDLDLHLALGRIKFDFQWRRDRALKAATILRNAAEFELWDESKQNFRPPLLCICSGITKACLDHILDVRKRDVSKNSNVDPHIGSDQSTPEDRMDRYGDCSGRGAEILLFKPSPKRKSDGTPMVVDVVKEVRHVMRQLIEDNERRTMLFDPSWQYAGIASGPHAFLGSTVCIVFCDEFDANPYAPFVPQKVKTRVFGNGWMVCFVSTEPIDLNITLPACTLM